MVKYKVVLIQKTGSLMELHFKRVLGVISHYTIYKQ